MWGWLFLFSYCFVVGALWQRVFERGCGWEKGWATRLSGWFTALMVLGFFGGIFVAWYRLTAGTIAFSYLLGFLFTLIVWRQIKKMPGRLSAPVTFSVAPFGWNKSRLFIAGFIILWAAGFYFLFHSTATGALFSPWQAIHPVFLFIFFLLTVLLGILLFSKYTPSTILFFIVLHSILLHSYMPLSHQLPWGGDVWRHIGVEQKLLAGEFYPPVLFGPEAKYRGLVPEAFLIPNKYAYAQLWALSVILARTLHASLLTVNQWLIPILWSVIMPILLYRLGRQLFASAKTGLALALLAVLPFPFQALGGLTLPVSLGYLTFFFVLTLWLEYIRTGDRRIRNITWLFGGLMVFGYTLAFFLLLIVIGLTFLVKKIQSLHSKKLQSWLFTLIAVASLFIFPVIELASHSSYVPGGIDFIHNLKQFLGQFSGWFYASAIRPTDIASGNIIFNHTPNYAFVPAVFTAWRWWLIPAMLGLWALVYLGLRQKENNDIPHRLCGLLFTTVVGGYVIGWFILAGDRTFVRRLDGMIAFIIMIFFMFGLCRLQKFQIPNSKFQIPLLILFFAWFTTATYASGPDLRVVSTDEYMVAAYVWQQLDHQAKTACVLADTRPLLALEGLSARQVVGGGFPIDYQFGQPERVALYQAFLANPEANSLTVAKMKTGAKRCIVILPFEAMSETARQTVTALFGASSAKVGGFMIWQEK